MVHWDLIIVAFVAFWGLAYLEAPLWAWSLSMVLSLGVIQHFETFSPICFNLLWILLLTGIALLGCPWLRRRLFTFVIFKQFQKSLPSMSSTEKEAIEAGDVWWEQGLFQGRPNWDQFLKLPKPQLTEEELYFLNYPVEELCALIHGAAVSVKSQELQPAVWNFLKEKGFFGMIIPKQYGGLGFSALAHSTIVQKIATHNLAAAITVMVPNSLGPAELLLNYGTDSQKEQYLQRLARGQEIPCFALTSPEAGSDAGGIVDQGIVCEGEFAGKKILGIKLTWNKRYITLAPVATVLGLAFKLYDPNQLLGKELELGITVCLLPTNHPGVEIGLRHFPIHQSFLNGPTRGEDVFVPLDWVIGGPKMIGKGWQMLVECLSAGRGISLPALSTATAKLCYRTTGAYAMVRKQFHASIAKFEGVAASLAKIAGFTYLIEAARLFTITPLDQQIRPSIVSAIAKYHMTEMGRQVINEAMDVHGGRAIMLGQNNYLAACYTSIPISITVEGANILTRNLIIFGQGAIRCHPYIQQEMMSMIHPEKKEGLRLFDKAFVRHFRYSLSNVTRVLLHSLTAGLFCYAPPIDRLNGYYRQLTRMSVALSWISDVALIVLGGKLKRAERLSARLGDVLSHLYLGSAVLKYFQDFGNENDDLPYVEWCLQTCLFQCQAAFLAFLDNFPLRFLGRILKWMIFPFGRPYAVPSDKLDQVLAASMTKTSPFRERLTQHFFKGHVGQDPIAALEEAFNQMNDVAVALTKFETAIRKGAIPKYLKKELQFADAVSKEILTEKEVQDLKQFEAVQYDAIRVDEFTNEQLAGK